MSPFREFLLSCSAVVLVAGLVVVILIVLSRRRRGDRSDREIIAELTELPLSEQIATFKSGTARMRGCAAAALAESREPEAVEALVSGLDDPDEAVVSTILKALADMGDGKAWDALLNKLQQDDSIAYRPGLLPKGVVNRRDELVEWLVGRVNKGDAGAIAAVADYPTSKAAEFLIGMLRDLEMPMSDRRRREAAESLARIYLTEKLGRIHQRLIEKMEQPVWLDPRSLNAGDVQSEDEEGAATAQMRMADFIALARDQQGLGDS